MSQPTCVSSYYTLSNSILNHWSKRSSGHDFDFEPAFLKQAVNIFESLEISENIYEGVLEPSYKKSTRKESNHSGHIRKVRVIPDP